MTYVQWREDYHDEIFYEWVDSGREKSFELFARELWERGENRDYE